MRHHTPPNHPTPIPTIYCPALSRTHSLLHSNNPQSPAPSVTTTDLPAAPPNQAFTFTLQSLANATPELQRPSAGSPLRSRVSSAWSVKHSSDSSGDALQRLSLQSSACLASHCQSAPVREWRLPALRATLRSGGVLLRLLLSTSLSGFRCDDSTLSSLPLALDVAATADDTARGRLSRPGTCYSIIGRCGAGA
ncbi:hypothetical protein KC19_3G230100 [Ceratodon purpureus]|uniref:Uncharacterized protein n=1 Tax=Ceratodon purpureus TaxID=3225 RepID=A0A8T0INY5_CERPU|nr:hypothetical protein KC19_3G230100 [Ceratodon purpureus]